MSDQKKVQRPAGNPLADAQAKINAALDDPAYTPEGIVKAIEIKTTRDSAAAGSIVTLGDSITDGAASKINRNDRWPDVLARRLQADKSLSGMGRVLNAGINGNRLLHDGDGQSALGGWTVTS